jgi:hypothetical protein
MYGDGVDFAAEGEIRDQPAISDPFQHTLLAREHRGTTRVRPALPAAQRLDLRFDPRLSGYQRVGIASRQRSFPYLSIGPPQLGEKLG